MIKAPQYSSNYFTEAINNSSNMVIVDTATSTSDTVAIMANGLTREVDIYDFRYTLNKMSIPL